MKPGDSIKTAISEIRRKHGSQAVQTAPEMLACYSFDATNLRSRPAGVVFPRSTEEVRSLVKICGDSGTVLIPRGAGTGFAGGTVPLDGGIVMSTEKLNRVLYIDQAEKVAAVQPGVINGALQKEVAKVGLMFPPDPSSLEVSTLGGNVAQDAGGPRALKYGVTRDYVLGVEFITWEGKMVEPAGPGAGHWGWDPLSQLMVGSEGTLGIITRIWLRLLRQPQSYSTVLTFFRTPVEAAGAVSKVLDCGVIPAAVELIDAQTMECVIRLVEIRIPSEAGCSLLIETDGQRDEAGETMAAIRQVLDRAGAMDIRVAASHREREDLWKMRRSISPSLARIAPCKLNEDVCVPRSRLPALVEAVGRLAKKYGLLVPTFGHAGDGNLHVNVMLDRRNRDQVRRAEALVDELFEATMALDGSISGEHGIGITKIKYLPRQVGPVGLEIQGAVKRAFDPHSLMNPGKVIRRT